MKTTYFRPSIHGWPFGNLWTKSFGFDTVTLEDMGFCGGMCWIALQRFYNAIAIPRNTPAPSEGDALYNDIWDIQVNSVPASTLWKIFEWQRSPDLSQRLNPLHSLGHRTQKEWPKVKESLKASKPVTITLIASSNDYNLMHLEDSHRVVAYAYDIDSIVQGEGAPEGADYKVTIWIYDPNYPDRDDVRLTFYRGAERNNIRLRHSIKGDKYHGFFKDDKDRSYNYSDATYVRIDECEQTGISSATRADYDLKFSWQCRFIPYFNILINGESWKSNRGTSGARSRYEPTNKDNKQCSSRAESLTVSLELPRDLSTVAVRLLKDNDYYDSIEVDASTAFKCYPYIRSRAFGEAPCVCDYDIKDTDLYIKDPNPSNAAVQQLDTSEFRWVMNVSEGHRDTRRRDRDDLTTAYVEAIEFNQLGNVVVPILANFEERNLAAPTVKSGVVQTIRNGVVLQTTNLDPLADQAQKIFDGFLDNPADYDNDTRVEFTYQSRDNFGVVAQGQATFYGKSILHEQSTITIDVFDPNKFARLEGIARELVERGLIDVAINPPPGWPGPRPSPFDPVRLIKKLRRNRQLQGIIDQAFQSSWGNRRIWKQIWDAQSELLKQADIGKTIHIEGKAKKGKVLKATKELQEMQQREFDALVLNIVAQRTINKLRRNTNAMNILMSLQERASRRVVKRLKTGNESQLID